MWTHNKVTKQAGIKIDYRTCYWFHLFGTPLLLASSFLPIFPLFFSFTCFFFPFVFFFFRFCLVQNEKFSTLDGLYRIDSETDGVTLKLEIAYYWILSTSRIFHAKLEWPRPNVSISIFIYTSALFPWPSLLSFSLFSPFGIETLSRHVRTLLFYSHGSESRVLPVYWLELSRESKTTVPATTEYFLTTDKRTRTRLN